MNRDLVRLAVASVSGLLFGSGLFISGMVNPHKVLSFLDFRAIPTGGWDPSLAFVMVPAVVVMLVAAQVGKRRGRPLLDRRFHGPGRDRIDAQLLVGAALFGVGWGMTGLCPGPALALLALPPENLWIFLLALVAGSWLGGLRPTGLRTQAAQ